jgi:uncharacterized protein (UPF0210 family)
MDLPRPEADAATFRETSAFLSEARASLESVGFEVQTTRVAGPDLAGVDADLFAAWAASVESAARDAGIGYVSLGRIPAGRPDLVETLAAPVIAAGQIAFLSADLLEGGRPSLPMAAACARAVRALSASTPLGFGNLRFAATAGCPPNIPFLPAAYHVGGSPRFAVAVQAADVVLEALRGVGSTQEIEDRLVAALEASAGPLEARCLGLAERFSVPFVGIDLSPAPYPSDEVSIGGALEAVGVERFGAWGTLYAAALVTRAMRRTRLRRSGFSGLMLPLLEDSVLARRAAHAPLSLHELLLYSAVCGTGLDTVPLPGDVDEADLAGILLDVAALSVALGGKPLTARLLPVPGARAGDQTPFTFEYFSNTRVLAVPGRSAARLLERGT